MTLYSITFYYARSKYITFYRNNDQLNILVVLQCIIIFLFRHFFLFSFIKSSNHSSVKVGNKVGITSVGVGEKVGKAEDGTYVGSGVIEAVGSDVGSEVGESAGFMDVGLSVSVEVFIKSNATIKSARGVFVSLQHIDVQSVPM